MLIDVSVIRSKFEKQLQLFTLWSHEQLHAFAPHSTEYSLKRNKQQTRTAPPGLLEFPVPIITRQITLVTQARRPYFQQLSVHPRDRRAVRFHRSDRSFVFSWPPPAHAHPRKRLCGRVRDHTGQSGVGQDSFVNLADTLSAAASVRLAHVISRHIN